MLDLNKGLLLSFAVNSRSKWRPIFVTGHVPLSHTLERTARPDLPRIWLVQRFGACARPRAFPKGTLHLIPEPEEKASERVFEKLTLPLRSRAHPRDYGSHEHPMLRHRSQRRRMAWIAPYLPAVRSGGQPTHERPARRP